MRCPGCNAEVPDAGRFCSGCGAPLGSLAEATLTSVPEAAESDPPASGSSRSRTGRRASRSGATGPRFLPGDLVGNRYRIVGPLGRGGMGDVFRADDLELDQAVALKFLPEALERDEERLSRLRTEVRLARQVSHPNVCRVYDIGEQDGRYYLSMEYVDGEDLATLLRRIGRLPEDKALEIARQICAGLAAAHNRGVIHRDLKPANVMIDGEGQVRLADFGLAGLVDSIEGHEIRAGTPNYMAPEQIRGEAVTPRSDLYALGHVLYELFTGKPAFRADTLAELTRMQTRATPTLPSTWVEGLQPAVERVILRCLEKDPARRPRSAFAVAAALPGGDPLAAALEAGETPSPELVADAEPADSPTPPMALTLAAAFLVLTGLVAVLGSGNRLLELVGPGKPPPALEADARGLAQRLGHVEPPVDRKSGFGVDTDYLEWVEANDDSSTRWSALSHVRPSPLRFWYRQSPAPLVASRMSGDVSYSNPSATTSGMLRMQLDPDGRLVELLAVPPQRDPQAETTAEPDWGVLIDAAGLDPASLESTTPEWNPLVDCDFRRAWVARYLEQHDVPVRVEAGAYRGRAVYFQVVAPWTRAHRMDETRPPAGVRAVNVILLVLSLVLAIGAAVLARRNLSRGRGDRKGAARMAIFVLVLLVIGWALGSHHVATSSEIGLLFLSGLRPAVFFAGVVWLAYLAVEPYVRRLWPHALIAWTRVLSGRFADPLLGRDLLVGGAAGAAVAFAFTLGAALPAWTGGGATRPLVSQPGILDGPGAALSWLLAIEFGALLTAMGLFLLMLLLRIALRRVWLAVGATFLLMAGLSAFQNFDNPWGWALAAAGWAMLILVTVRFGLLASILTLSFADLLLSAPITLRWSAWYAGLGWGLVSVGALAVVYGLYLSLSGQRLFEIDLLEVEP